MFFLTLFTMIAIGMPAAIVFRGMTVLPGTLDASFPYMVETAIRSMVSGSDSSTLLAVPLFMFSGIIMAKGRTSEKLFNFFAYFIGNRTVGIPRAVIITCMFYDAISGSSPATMSAVGVMTIPFLISFGYDGMFSTSVATVTGDLGAIIPSGTSYIIYPSTSGVSPSALFTDGITPGVLIGTALIIYAYIKCRKSGGGKEKLAGNYNRIRDMGSWNLFKESFTTLLTLIIIPGGICGGIASPTEVAVVSVVYALIINIFIYKTLKVNKLGNLLVEDCKTHVITLFVISTATAFGCAPIVLRYLQVINKRIPGNISNRTTVVPVINLVLLVFDMIPDNIPNIMILIPIFLPMATIIDMDPVYFGIMMTANLAISMVTPPMGINLYVASSMIKILVLKIARAAIPFLISFFIALLLIVLIPWLSLWLMGV